MSFIDEHYGNLFRVLALSRQSLGLQNQTAQPAQEEPGASAADERQVVGDNNAEKRLAQRAFDLSTLVLSASNETSRLVQSSQSNVLEEEGSLRSTPASIRVSVTCPSISSILGDLQLVRSTAESNASATPYVQGQTAAVDLVVMSAVAALHARTIGQLLDSALPLSIDMDYWNAKDDGTISLVMYFIQSLPHRLVGWSAQTLNAIVGCAASDGSEWKSLLHQIRAAMASNLLFPELRSHGAAASMKSWTRKLHTPLPRIPENANIISLTRREIRHKQRQLADAQQRLAEMIGTLSQVAIGHDEQTGVKSTSAEALLRQVSDVASSLGCDIAANELAEQHSSSIGDLAQSTERLAALVQGLSAQLASRIQLYRRPSLLARCWIPTLVAVLGARSLSLYVAGHREDLKSWLTDAAVTLTNYVSQYMLAPLRSAYETIRYGTHTYSVMTKESLRSDLTSLEDMVVGFSKRFGDIDPLLVRKRVDSGDLSDVMRVYSREMQQPFRNAVFGDLVQAMLIQVQKVKVDVGQTMAALDKLLKSNELNFLLLSTVPATLTIYAAIRWLYVRASWWIGGSSRHTTSSIQAIMRDIDRLLNIDTSEKSGAIAAERAIVGGDSMLMAAPLGRLICLTHYLRHHATSLSNSTSAGWLGTSSGWVCTLPHARSLFLQDIRDLESAVLTSTQKRRVVERMYRTFRFI